ncbi:MAG: hypothetical protein ACO24D_14400, partial [bacterium]
LLARNSLYDCSIGEERVGRWPLIFWSCVSPEINTVGQILSVVQITLMSRPANIRRQSSRRNG